MSHAALAFIAGLGGGYIKGKQQAKEQDLIDAKNKRDQELHDAQMTDLNQKQADRQNLRDASAPVQVEQVPVGVNPDSGAWDKPATPVPDSTYQVGKGANAQQFATQGIANDAATKMNTPDGTRQRQIAAMAANGDIAGSMSAEASQLTIDAHKQEAADKLLKKRIDGFKTPDDVAAFISETPADGQGGALKVKAVASTDGKTIDYLKVNEDGSMTPTGKSFPNTPQGMEDAKLTLAGYFTPEKRMEHYQFEQTRESTDKHQAAMEKIAQQQANTQEQYRKDQSKLMNDKNSLKGANGSVKLDEVDRLRMKDAETNIRDAEKMVNESLKTLVPGDDPLKNPAVVHAQNLVKKAKLDQFRTHVQIGVITPEGMADQIMGVAANTPDVAKSLKELADSVGTKFSDQVALQIQSNDKWKQLNAPPKAATPPNAAALAKQGAAPAAAAPQSFNEVGYKDTQGTIDGAKRGDPKARAFLKTLIDRGVTTPQQRQEIANLTR